MQRHDRLQTDCFVWFWNKYPECRYLMHANINSHPKWEVQDIVKLKPMGLVKGNFDLEFYYYGKLYLFDIKIGNDRLNTYQLAFLKQIEKHGGEGHEIRALEDFKTIIKDIINV